jgi:hypothetical protein
MKRFLGTPLFANIVALIALGASLLALRESRTALDYTQRQYTAEKRELLLKLVKSSLQNEEQLKAEYNLLLKDTDFKLTTGLAIQLGQIRPDIEFLITNDQHLIRMLESERTLNITDPSIWLSQIRAVSDNLEKITTLRANLSELREDFLSNEPPKLKTTPVTPIATQPSHQP